MATEEDQIRLRVEAEAAQVERLRARLNELKDAVERQAPGWEMASKAIRETEAELRKAERAAERAAAELAALPKAGMDFGRVGMGINQMAQGLEDLQYSVGGAMNNIGSAIQMFGGPVGLVAGMTLAGIAVNQLIRHWDGLQNALGMGIATPALEGTAKLEADLKKAADRMEELQKKTRLTLEEFIEFRKVQAQVAEGKARQEQEKEAKAVTGITAEGTDKNIQDFQKAVKEGGGGEALESTLTGAFENQTDENNKVLDPVTGKLVSPLEAAQSLARQASAGDVEARKRIQAEIETFNPNSKFLGAFDENSEEGRARAAADKAREDGIKADVERGIQEQEAADKRAADEQDLQAEAAFDELNESNERARKAREAREKEAKAKKKFDEESREYPLRLMEARLGLGAAQMGLYKNVFANPERIASGDFARKVESAGVKEPLEVARQQLQVLKAIENYTKLAANPPKLGK